MSGGQGPSWGSQPTSAAWGDGAPPPPKRSPWKFVALGCLALIALTCAGGMAAFFLVRGAVLNLGPGTEIASATALPGAPYELRYRPAKRNDTAVWLDLDVTFAAGVQLTGPIMVRSNGTPVAQYNLNLTSGECHAPVRGESTSMCFNWRTTNLNGSGSLSGQTRMFKVPAQPAGAVVTVTGMVFASPGVQVRRLRLYAAE